MVSNDRKEYPCDDSRQYASFVFRNGKGLGFDSTPFLEHLVYFVLCSVIEANKGCVGLIAKVQDTYL